MLLGAVVDVSLESAPFLVLGVDEPTPGLLELLRPDREVLGRTSIPIAVSDQGLGRLAPDVEAALYFYAVEAVQNSVKHADASSIEVTLTSDGRQARLQVRDDGTGFAHSADAAGRGIGNMRDRIDAVQGSFTLETALGHGTTVVATIPLRRSEVAS